MENFPNTGANIGTKPVEPIKKKYIGKIELTNDSKLREIFLYIISLKKYEPYSHSQLKL